jgi:hypothetical protein
LLDRLPALENAPGIDGKLAGHLAESTAIAHQGRRRRHTHGMGRSRAALVLIVTRKPFEGPMQHQPNYQDHCWGY